jgi:choline transporter-like protein 2/4/5
VDALLADTDPDAPDADAVGAAEGKEKSEGEAEAAPADAEGEAEAAPKEPAEPVEPIGDEFKPIADRGCTDTLCCVLFLACMVLWGGLAFVAFYFGNPYSVVYGVDYEGSICSHSCGANADPLSNCTAANIATKKYAHFPRITSDLLAQRADIALGKIPVFYTVCVETCPVQWDIVCSYKYEAKYPTWRDYPASVKACLAATASLPKFIVSSSPSLLTATLQAAEASGTIASAQFCEETYNSCDVTGVGTTMTLNRCIPTQTSTPSNTTERCISPTTDTPCTPDSGSNFDTDCVPNADGEFVVPLYTPTRTEYEGYFLDVLADDAKSNCVTKQTYKESLTEELASSDQLDVIVNSLRSASALFSDIITAYYAILAVGFGAAMVFSWLYVGLLRFCTRVLVWGTCVILEITFILGTVFLLARAGVIDASALYASARTAAEVSVGTASNDASYNATAEANSTDARGTWNTAPDPAGTLVSSYLSPVDASQVTFYTVAGYACGVFSFLWLCVLIFLRKAIQTAVKVIQIACMALGSMPTLILFPLVTYGGVVVLATFWLAVAILLKTAGTISTENLANSTAAAANDAATANATGTLSLSFEYQQVASMPVIDYLWAVHIFMGLWMNAFIQGVAMLTIAGAVSKWYFTPRKSLDTFQGRCPVCRSYRVTCRFHLGTVAFGALIIAIVQFIRLVVGYIQKKLNQAGESRAKKIIMCLVQCCLWCLEKCVKFISKNAYIYTALKGTSFCWSAFKSFFLILNNLAGFGITSLLTLLLLLMGKLAVVIVSCYFCYLWLNYDPVLSVKVASDIMPVIATGLIAFFVSNAFFEIVANTMDTVLLNYCVDLQRQESGKAMAADDKLGAVKDDMPDQTESKEDELEAEAPTCCKCCSCCNCLLARCFDSKPKKVDAGNKVAPAGGEEGASDSSE